MQRKIKSGRLSEFRSALKKIIFIKILSFWLFYFEIYRHDWICTNLHSLYSRQPRIAAASKNVQPTEDKIVTNMDDTLLSFAKRDSLLMINHFIVNRWIIYQSVKIIVFDENHGMLTLYVPFVLQFSWMWLTYKLPFVPELRNNWLLDSNANCDLLLLFSLTLDKFASNGRWACSDLLAPVADSPTPPFLATDPIGVCDNDWCGGVSSEVSNWLTRTLLSNGSHGQVVILESRGRRYDPCGATLLLVFILVQDEIVTLS